LGSAAKQGNWNGLRRALALLRKRPAFFGILALLLVVGVALMTAAHTDMIFTHESEVPRDLAGSLGEALIVAFFLALLVDPVAQHQFATEWGRDLYWAIFSPDAPAEFRESLQLLAAPTGYIRRCTDESGLRRSCVMSVSSEADPEGIRGWCGSRLRWRSPSARRLHQTVRTGDFTDAAAATGAYGHAAVAWKPLVGNHAPRSGP